MPAKAGFRGAVLVTLCAALAGCATHWHWPWHHKPKPAPQPVTYVSVQADNAPGILQYWDRNTLQFDLTTLSGDGTATITPVKSVGWPVRLEFLVRPGSFGLLEVTGAQRIVFEIPSQAKVSRKNPSNNLVLKLAPGVYLPDTQAITLRWSAAGDSGH